MCLATVWIVFTRILNVIIESQCNCLVQLLNGLVQLLHLFVASRTCLSNLSKGILALWLN